GAFDHRSGGDRSFSGGREHGHALPVRSTGPDRGPGFAQRLHGPGRGTAPFGRRRNLREYGATYEGHDRGKRGTRMSEQEITRHPDAKALAVAVADELIRQLHAAVADRGVAHLVLTGGGIGIAVLAELHRTARRVGLDWSNIHLWWGDE